VYRFANLKAFATPALRDLVGSRAPTKDPNDHLRAAVEWLERAHDRSPDDGVSYGYSIRGGWRPAYRETSGYIATTFLELSRQLDDVKYRARALRICRWLIGVQNEDGSISNPRFGDAGIVFDTGQVLFGLVRAYEETGEDPFRHGARRAADWLVKIADASGRWTRNEYLDTPHVYNTRTAWALLRMNQVAHDADRERVARVNLDWAVSEQRASGFFDHCAFAPGSPPFTHTIAYATRGLLESGLLIGETRYREAAERCARAALAHMRDDGFLPGQITVAGSGAASYCCLTGNCQFAIVWAKLYRATGDERFRQAALRALDYVMRCQDLRDANPDVRGGIKGSQPIWGHYAPFCFPNWATKFFIDAMLLRRHLA
jgi:hypothetical protein